MDKEIFQEGIDMGIWGDEKSFDKKYTRQEFIELLSMEKRSLIIKYEDLKYKIDGLLKEKQKLDEIVDWGEREKEKMTADFKNKLHTARIDDYRKWLKGFAKNGGKVTIRYSYPWSRWDWKLVVNDIKLIPLYGSESFSLIVKKGVKVQGDAGHIDIFYLEDYTYSICAPEFSDIQIDMFE